MTGNVFDFKHSTQIISAIPPQFITSSALISGEYLNTREGTASSVIVNTGAIVTGTTLTIRFFHRDDPAEPWEEIEPSECEGYQQTIYRLYTELSSSCI